MLAYLPYIHGSYGPTQEADPQNHARPRPASGYRATWSQRHWASWSRSAGWWSSSLASFLLMGIQWENQGKIKNKWYLEKKMNGIVTSSRFFKWIIGIQWECIYILLLYIIIYLGIILMIFFWDSLNLPFDRWMCWSRSRSEPSSSTKGTSATSPPVGWMSTYGNKCHRPQKICNLIILIYFLLFIWWSILGLGILQLSESSETGT